MSEITQPQPRTSCSRHIHTVMGTCKTAAGRQGQQCMRCCLELDVTQAGPCVSRSFFCKECAANRPSVNMLQRTRSRAASTPPAFVTALTYCLALWCSLPAAAWHGTKPSRSAVALLPARPSAENAGARGREQSAQWWADQAAKGGASCTTLVGQYA